MFCAVPLLLALTCALAAAADLDRIWTGDFAPPRPLDSLRVIDWNVDRGSELDKIGAAMVRQEPDLLVIQEVDLFARRSGTRNVTEDLARRLNLNFAFAPEFQELGQGSQDRPAYQGQALLTRLPIRNVRILKFQEQSGFWKPRPYLPSWSIMQRRAGGRTAMVAELEFAGRTLVVYNAHLESRSFGRIQNLQMDEILADARRYSEDTPIILAGDFNTKYNARAFLNKLRRAGWRSAFGNQTPRTHLIVCSLDWVLVRGPLQLSEGKVLRGVGASDHFPVSAKIHISSSH